MKLEMTVHGLNVNLELDDDAYNGLEVLQHVKDLIDELSAYNKVMLSILSTPDDEDFEEAEEENEEYKDMSEEDHVVQATWPFPEGGLDDQGAEIIAFVEPEQKTA
jgi:Ran GTPase-activating protein (RanGAP) involved in mRNA processing and transport